MDFNGFETMKLRFFLLSALVAFFSLVSFSLTPKRYCSDWPYHPVLLN